MINRINMKMNYILIFQIYDNFEYMDKNYIDLRKIIQINIWKWNFLILLWIYFLNKYHIENIQFLTFNINFNFYYSITLLDSYSQTSYNHL